MHFMVWKSDRVMGTHEKKKVENFFPFLRGG